KKAILCNGMAINATHNLVVTLQHLRHPDQARALWIDTLCINHSGNIKVKPGPNPVRRTILRSNFSKLLRACTSASMYLL
ncbi:hypothetical protein C8A05DRAFT_20087, partial [Staphylotrichum tortipilum]